MRSARSVVSAVAVAVCVPSVAAGQGGGSPQERFALFTSCSPVNVEVFVHNTGASDVTQESVARRMTGRLRDADIHAPSDQPGWALLRLTATISTYPIPGAPAQTVYMVRLRFMKLLYDQLSDPALATDRGRMSSDSLGAVFRWIHWAPTWESPRPGIGFFAGRRDDLITGAIDRLLDEFVAEYLRTNAAACE